MIASTHEPKSSSERVVLHADMDAFYASVEQRDDPSLRGKPVIVGGTSARGVVTAASYEARVFGVHSAMPGYEARRLCPHGIFLSGSMRKYSRESKRIFEIFRTFSPKVQGLSLDEAFLDLTGTARLLGPPRAVGERLRAEVRERTGLAVSVGIAPVKMVAKIASDACKPDGLLEIRPGEVRAFLDPLPIGRIWGVGPVAEARLVRLGIERVAAHERELLDYATRALAALPDVRLIGTARDKAAVLSFLVEGVHAHDVGTILDREGVAVRAGHHCAMPVMTRFGVAATARASLGVYNTAEDVDALVAALGKVRGVFG